MTGAAKEPVLGAAPPAELGAVHDRRVHRRHLAATVLDLADRGHLRVVDAGNDPTVGYALDWYLLLPGEEAPLGVDATDAAAAAAARPRVTAPAPTADGVTLRPHEQAVLHTVSCTPDRLLSRVRASAAAHGALGVLADDVVERGWSRHVLGARLRTRAGRAVAADLRTARAHLRDRPGDPDTTAALLALAVALGLEPVWTARLGQQRPPPPAWFTPGPARPARGWMGVCTAASAMAAAPPPGGGAGSAPSGGALPGPLG